jgi:hypothetical protein
LSLAAIRRISYVVPIGLIALLVWLGHLSWWAEAMLAGGFLFAWDWLWGDRALLDPRATLGFTGAGLACLAAAFWLAAGLNLSLGEFNRLADQLPRGERLLYQLPAIGVALSLYGLLGWSRAWLLQRDERW